MMSDRKGLLIEALFDANQSMANAMSTQAKCTYEDRLLITRLRAMLPQPVDGLPTEAGWYWWQHKCGGKQIIVEVIEICGELKCRYMPEGAFQHVNCSPVGWLGMHGTFYGPLTPLEVE
jgi:hypothetical protein